MIMSSSYHYLDGMTIKTTLRPFFRHDRNHSLRFMAWSLFCTLVRPTDKTCKMHACMQPIFFYKIWKIQTSCMEKSYKICLHLVKFLQKVPATWKIFAKSFIVLGFDLMFSGPEHRFLPLNLDRNPKNFCEGKCQNTQIKFLKIK